LIWTKNGFTVVYSLRDDPEPILSADRYSVKGTFSGTRDSRHYPTGRPRRFRTKET
jgi:hypothetical protein